MKIIDANIVLRYLLKDNSVLFIKAVKIIENENVFLITEIIAEIVYVLEKVYKVPKSEIKNVLINFFANNNIIISNKKLVNKALYNYEQFNLDFVDSLLLAYHELNKYEVIIFDKKLAKLLNWYEVKHN